MSTAFSMMMIKHYKLQADRQDAAALHAALNDLSAKIAVVDGVIKVDLYRDAQKPYQFLLVEQWQSEEAHKASSAVLGKDAFKPIMALLSVPPELETLCAVSTNGVDLTL